MTRSQKTKYTTFHSLPERKQKDKEHTYKKHEDLLRKQEEYEENARIMDVDHGIGTYNVDYNNRKRSIIRRKG